MSDDSSNKAISMGRDSASGSFKLFLGRTTSTLILALGTIIVGRYISDVDYGLYTVALAPISTLLLFQDWGIGAAMVRYCANYRALDRKGELRSIIFSGLTFATLTGVILTIFSFVASNSLASIIGKPDSGFLIAILSITILFSALSTFSMSVIVGFELMGFSSIVMVVSATIQGLISPLLVYLGYCAFGAIVGFTIASIASGVTGLVILYFVVLRKLPSGIISSKNIIQTLKPLLIYGIPLSIASLLEGFSLQIDNLVMAAYAELEMIGNFAIANNFVILITFLIYPLQTVLFPAFSKLDPSKDKELLKTVFSSSVKYSSLFIVPATMALMVLSDPLVATLYGDKWPHAPFFLTLTVACYLVVLLGYLSCSRLLYAMGETKILIKLSILTLCIAIPLAFILIPPFGVVGAIISGTLVAPSFSLCVSIYWIWKRYGVIVNFRNSAKILIASMIAALFTFVSLSAFSATAWITLVIGVFIFLITYLLAIPIIGAIDLLDISTLRIMFSSIGKTSKLLEIPLLIVERTINFKNKLTNR